MTERSSTTPPSGVLGAKAPLAPTIGAELFDIEDCDDSGAREHVVDDTEDGAGDPEREVA